MVTRCSFNFHFSTSRNNSSFGVLALYPLSLHHDTAGFPTSRINCVTRHPEFSVESSKRPDFFFFFLYLQYQEAENTMVATRSHTSTPSSLSPNAPTKTSSISIAEPSKPTSSPRRPPNKRALSSNHIGAPPDLFPRLSAHASRIHKAKSHILLFFLISILFLVIYFLNPNFLGSVIKALSVSSWKTIGVVTGVVAGAALGLVYWTNVYKVDWYEVVVGYWWLCLPTLGAVGWAVVMVREGKK